jgi:hypothetical protein
MRAPPNAKRAAPASAESGPQKDRLAGTINETEIKQLARGIQVALVDKGKGAGLRISVSSWRGLGRVEIREVTEVFPGTGFPTKAGVLMPVDLVDELASALVAAKAKAIALGLLPPEGARP